MRIKVINNIAEEGLKRFGSAYTLVDEEADALIVRSANLQEMVFESQLKAIARSGVGVNTIPLERCAEQGIVVFNTPGANANAVKELVVAGLLLASRDISAAITWAKSLPHDEAIVKTVEQEKARFQGQEIKGKTLGVVGLGAVGVLVANVAVQLGMQVLGYDPYISITNAWGLSSKVKRANSYDDVYRQADYLSLHVPLVDATHHLIHKERIKQMKKGIRILNFARAELVDDAAMLEALKSRKVNTYVTDFPNQMTHQMPNCIEIPHLGASTLESEVNCAIMAVDTLKDFFETGSIKNSVNYPDMECGPVLNPARIVLLHANVVNMVGQITTILGHYGINIEAMQNQSRKAWAYTCLDVDCQPGDDVTKALAKIEHVVRVRVIHGPDQSL